MQTLLRVRTIDAIVPAEAVELIEVFVVTVSVGIALRDRLDES